MPMQQKLAQGSDSRLGSPKHGPPVVPRTPNSQLPSDPTPNQIFEPRFHPMEYLALAMGNQCLCSKSWLKAPRAGQGQANMTRVWRQDLQTANFSLVPPQIKSLSQDSTPWIS